MYNAEQTRQQIMECAVHLFAQKGLQATSVTDIISAAGCSKGAFFYHFSKKEDMVEAVFRMCHDAIEDAAMEGTDALGSVLDKLCRRCYNLTRYAIEFPDETAVNSLYLGSTDHISKNGYGYRASHRHFESVNALVEAGIASGELKDLPPLLLGEFFYNIASVPYTYMQNNPECFENKAYWDDIYEIIRCALARRP